MYVMYVIPTLVTGFWTFFENYPPSNTHYKACKYFLLRTSSTAVCEFHAWTRLQGRENILHHIAHNRMAWHSMC